MSLDFRAEQLAEMKRLTEGGETGTRADQPEIGDIFTVGEAGEADLAESSETGEMGGEADLAESSETG
jgi:hypothetical protein